MVYVWKHEKVIYISYLVYVWIVWVIIAFLVCVCVYIYINKFDYRGTIIEPNIDLGVQTWYQT